MIPKDAKIEPGVKSFHLLFIDGPKWNSIAIPKNKISTIVNHFPYKINAPAYWVINSYSVRYFTANFPKMIKLIAIINISDRNKVNTRDNNLWLMIDLDSLTWYEALKASISEFIPLVEK